MKVTEPTTAAESPRHGAEPEWQVALLFPGKGEWTEEEFLALPTNRGVELSAGCLEVLPVPTEAHQMIVGFLYRLLWEFVAARGLGRVLLAGIPVRLWEGKIREPDVVYMRTENRGRRREQYWDGADLVMEVVSPEGRQRDLEVKKQEYARAGIPEYWIVDPEEELILVLSLSGEAYQESGAYRRGQTAVSRILTGFAVPVDAVLDSAAEA